VSPARTVLLALAVFLASSTPASAQAVEESLLLREAAARESQGDFEGAERVLRRLLEVTPSSSGGIFALERVLRAKGEPRALLPVADTFLAHDPTASGVRQLKIRVLVEVDSLEAVEVEAERWFQAQPASETAYREVARVFERAFGPDRALAVLERGRSAMGNRSAMALEMGDMLAATHRVRPAVEEWALAVGDDGAQASTVARRVAGLPDAPQGAARELVTILAGAQEPGRRQAAVQIALDLKLGGEALELARRLVPGLGERARMAFLADVARRARDADLGEVATWAYSELGQGAATPAERRQFDERLVEMSLAAGDTATALEAQRRVVASFTPGSVDRRRATALRLRLEGARSSPEALRGHLEEFRREFPEAPELDGLAAQVAGTLAGGGDRDGAAAVLEGMEGPLSSLERGYLLLDEGAADEARQAFLIALPGLEPGDATGVIQFVSLMGRLSPGARAALVSAGSLAHGGKGGAAARRLAAAADSVREEERAPILAEAARIADGAGQLEEGAELRRRLIEEHPDAPETQEAALALARYAAASPGGADEAVKLLEELVARWPGAAVAPDARRELERLRRIS
jgi:tetratricopeptide (TPR) repeat protein